MADNLVHRARGVNPNPELTLPLVLRKQFRILESAIGRNPDPLRVLIKIHQAGYRIAKKGVRHDE